MFYTGHEGSTFVGRDEQVKKLKTEIDSEDTVCKVISVVGERGIGKTTLVKTIYRKVQKDFEFSTFVYVSDEPRVTDVLVQIATEAGLGKDETGKNLETKLQSLLAEKKCLICLDDIRSDKTWEDLQKALPTSSRNGSRIIITSREPYVGGGDGSCSIKLDPLGEKDGRELFWNPTSMPEATEETELEEIGSKIVEKCRGIPSAIVFVADMLSGEKWRKNKHAWEEVLHDMDKISDILSFINMEEEYLPMDLTACFLYIGVRPEYTDISVSELTRLLLAEELIRVEGARDPEAMVKDKLEELRKRKLIQVSKRTWDDTIKSCHMNHFQRRVCIHHANKTNFFSTVQHTGFAHFTAICRLLIDDCKLFQLHSYAFRYSSLRTLLCFAKDKKDSETNSIPGEISHLSRLICLKLNGHYKQMQSSVSKLEKLQILDVEEATFDTQLFSASSNIWRMESVKHLLLSRHHFGDTKAVSTTPQRLIPKLKCNNSSVRNEMNLKNVEMLGWINGDILKTTSFQNLKKLKLFDATAQHIDELSKLENLQQLWLNADSQQCSELKMSNYEKLDLLHLSSHWTHDITLKHIEFPPNLTQLILKGIKFKADPMIELKKLPKLEFLKLKNCFYLLILDCLGPNSFPELQVLEITNSFSKLIVDDTGMPKLRKFVCGGDAKPNIPERLRAIMRTRRSDKTENASIHKNQNEESMISKPELEASKAEQLSNQYEGTGEATNQDLYSTMVCMNILNKMEGVSDQVYMKAINAFKDPDFRISFVMMPEIRRGYILKKL